MNTTNKMLFAEPSFSAVLRIPRVRCPSPWCTTAPLPVPYHEYTHLRYRRRHGTFDISQLPRRPIQRRLPHATLLQRCYIRCTLPLPHPYVKKSSKRQ